MIRLFDYKFRNDNADDDDDDDMIIQLTIYIQLS